MFMAKHDALLFFAPSATVNLDTWHMLFEIPTGAERFVARTSNYDYSHVVALVRMKKRLPQRPRHLTSKGVALLRTVESDVGNRPVSFILDIVSL